MKDETQTQSGAGSLQRGPQESSGSKSENRLQVARKKQLAVKEGHLTGGYCDTEELLKVEKEIYGIVSKQLEEAKEKHGYSPDPKFKHPEIRKLELELNGLAYKPKLVVSEA